MASNWVGLFDSFADGTPGGNLAAVTLSDEPPTETAMAEAARRLGAPTTGFVTVDAATRQGTATARFFTPRQEIGACGHVTIAIVEALVLRGIWPADNTERTVLARGGQYPVRVDRSGDGDVIEMRQRLGYLADPSVERWRVSDLLDGLRLHDTLPLRVASTGLRHLLVPAVSVPALAALVPRPHAIAELAGRATVDTVAVYAVQDTAPGRARVRMRDLCAGIGDLEEPASGTTAGALAAHLRDQLPALAATPSTVEIRMGIEMGSPSRIDVILDGPDIRVCGTAVLR